MGRRASAIGILIVLCLALVSCEAKGMGGRGRGRGCGRGRGRGGGRGGRGPMVAVTDREFNVVRYGAKPGAKPEDNTQAFMSAWVDACNFPGNGRVMIPPGVYTVAELIFGGPCKGPAPQIQVFGTVKADTDLSNYPNKAWITITDVNGLSVTGGNGGVIDAQGQAVWKYNDCKTNSDCIHLPATLYLNNVSNSQISEIHLENSMGFHMHITNSFFVRVFGLKINAPGDSPNTDGIHVSRSRLVKIWRTQIGTGDDCISIGQGATDVTVSRVTCGPGHGISVGSLGKLPDEMDVRGIVVRQCTLTGTTNGVRIKTFAASSPSRASGVVFSDITMNNVHNPIIIDQTYGGRSATQPSRVKISDVTYRNIKGTTASPVAVNLLCSKLVPCDNLQFHDIDLRPKFAILGGLVTSACTNARASYFGLQFPKPC